MVVPCRFYASGNCRFGSHCRFSHGNGEQQLPNRIDVGGIGPAEAGPIWPFSSYRDYNTGRLYLEDYSMEEVILMGRQFGRENYGSFVDRVTLLTVQSFQSRANLGLAPDFRVVHTAGPSFSFPTTGIGNQISTSSMEYQSVVTPSMEYQSTGSRDNNSLLGEIPTEILERDAIKYTSSEVWKLGQIPEMPPPYG